MTIRVNPKLINELESYGAEDVQKCYHCGNCSAVCHHSDEHYIFPRKPMRLLQMGLEKRLETSLEPWLCYYCGQCSTQCPRGAEPGETMMSLRRWLTSRYDFTGISRLFYRSWKAEVLAIVLVAVATGAAFFYYGTTHGDLSVYDGPNAFLPSSVVHLFDWAMAGVLSSLLAINALRMWAFINRNSKGGRPGIGAYLKSLPLLPLHFVTQKRYRDCDSKRPWFLHLILMLSYVTMLVLIMFFLKHMQQGPEIAWYVHAFGYAASAGLLLALGNAIFGRLRKAVPHLRHSHESDWIFLVMLAIVTITGVAQHALHRLGSAPAANIAYVVHLAFVVPMLTLEVPFSKWSHMIYRPLAMYLADVRSQARERQVTKAPASGSQLADRTA